MSELRNRKYRVGQKIRLTTDLFYIKEGEHRCYGGLLTREEFEECAYQYLKKGDEGRITAISDDGTEVVEAAFADHSTGLEDIWFEIILR